MNLNGKFRFTMPPGYHVDTSSIAQNVAAENGFGQNSQTGIVHRQPVLTVEAVEGGAIDASRFPVAFGTRDNAPSIPMDSEVHQAFLRAITGDEEVGEDHEDVDEEGTG